MTIQSRQARLLRIKENPEVGVLIVGAGINGIGTFRDLALQGVDVLLVERGDYCSGASAASSHMVHGGIRYLENGEFSLVREAVQERNRLIENTPHLVKPLPTTFPIFKWFSGLLNAPLKFMGLLEKPSERGAVVIKIGMVVYDFFTRKQRTVPKHIFRNRKDSLELFPDLNPEVLFTGTYYDGAMPSPERIATEVLSDALEAGDHAAALNYVSLVSAEKNTVQLKDEVSGDIFEVRPRILVNAAGPWIDIVNTRIGKDTDYISATKGSHLILDNPQLRAAIGENEFFFENKDGRIVLIFPLLDKVMIGTSDLRIDDPDQAVITEEEVDYFFGMIGRVFPDISLDKSQVVYTFSGVRPLQHTEGAATGQISRNHVVKVNQAGEMLDIPVFSLVGGKWTSFRAFSEHAADQILAYLGKDRKISTGNLSIGGSKDYPGGASEKEAYLQKLQDTYQVDKARVKGLFESYGTRAEKILEEQGSRVSQGLNTIPEISLGEIRHILSNEDVLHLDDLILRRTSLAKFGKITPESLREISGICAETLGWSRSGTEDEIDRFVEIMKGKHKMDFNHFMGD
jgi:glycerol-3-phosphate dehydrogenase